MKSHRWDIFIFEIFRSFVLKRWWTSRSAEDCQVEKLVFDNRILAHNLELKDDVFSDSINPHIHQIYAKQNSPVCSCFCRCFPEVPNSWFRKHLYLEGIPLTSCHTDISPHFRLHSYRLSMRMPVKLYSKSDSMIYEVDMRSTFVRKSKKQPRPLTVWTKEPSVLSRRSVLHSSRLSKWMMM